MESNDDEFENVLRAAQSPFTWDVIPRPDRHIEDYISVQTEKSKNIDDEKHFKWVLVILNLVLSYEICESLGDFDKSLEHIDICVEHLETLDAQRCSETFFITIRRTLWHVVLATKAFVLSEAGYFDEADETISRLKEFMALTSNREKAGVCGIQAAFYLQYGAPGQDLAVEAARQARKLDPLQAEWAFLVGNALGRKRRLECGDITDEEENAIEKAVTLDCNASYLVHLAQLYSEKSNNIWFSIHSKKQPEKKQNILIYAKKAVDRYMEAISKRPNCASLLIRAAHGLIRIKINSLLKKTYVKSLLDKGKELMPNNAMVYHDLGYYHEKLENNTKEALANLEKAVELGNYKALLYMITLKWKHSLKSQIIKDLQKAQKKFNLNEKQADLAAHLGVCYLLIQNNWPLAVKEINKSLRLDPSGKFLKRYICFNGQRRNILTMMTNELRLKKSRRPATWKFLKLVKKITPPQLFREPPKAGQFGKWKKTQLSVVTKH